MGSRHPKIAVDALFCISTLLMRDEHVSSIIHNSKTSDNGRIIVTVSISMKLQKLEKSNVKQYMQRFSFTIKAGK